mgnify:FL=1
MSKSDDSHNQSISDLVEENEKRTSEAKENLVRAKLRATIQDIQEGKEQSRDNSLERDNEIYTLLEMLKKVGLKEGEDYAFEEVPFDYNNTVPELNIRVDDNVLHFSAMGEVTDIIPIEEIVNAGDDSYEWRFLKLKSIDLEKLGIDVKNLDLERDEIEGVENHTESISDLVEENEKRTSEAKENLVRAKLRATIQDIQEGKEQSRDNSLERDNEIYTLLEMLKKVGLKEGEDYAFEEVPFDYNNTVPELNIRVDDNVLHFSAMGEVTDIIPIEEIVNAGDDFYEWRFLKLKSIDLEKLGIDVKKLDLKIDKIEETKSNRKEFEDSLLREDVEEYYLSKTPEELKSEFGVEVSRMVGFEQKNAHHCYDLWQHTLHTVASIDVNGLTEEQAKKLKVAAFFHDIGKPDVVGFNPRTNQQNFINHAMHSVDIATHMLEKLGYSKKEIQQISFYIAHHDDFLNYKGQVANKDKNHIFFRETTPSTVEEIVVQNQIDWEKLGIQCYLPTHTGNENIDKRNRSINSANNIKKRYICSSLVNEIEPTFKDFKNQPVKANVNMDDIKAKLATGEYMAEYIPTKEDYRLLLEICKADARAQSEKVITINPRTKQEVVSDTRDRKLSTIKSIEEVMDVAYREGTDKISEATKKEIDSDGNEFLEKMLRYATRRCEVRDNNNKAEKLSKEYENLLSKDSHSLDDNLR